MNSLEIYLKKNGVGELRAMNKLQDKGVVSDLCILAHDVAEVDCPAAIAFLEKPGDDEDQSLTAHPLDLWLT